MQNTAKVCSVFHLLPYELSDISEHFLNLLKRYLKLLTKTYLIGIDFIFQMTPQKVIYGSIRWCSRYRFCFSAVDSSGSTVSSTNSKCIFSILFKLIPNLLKLPLKQTYKQYDRLIFQPKRFIFRDVEYVLDEILLDSDLTDYPYNNCWIGIQGP